MRFVQSALLITISLALLLGLYSRHIYFGGSAVVFKSLESISNSGEHVYNRVRFIPGKENDTWLMQQSHFGHDGDYSEWDRLAIVVDKSEKPYHAYFYRLEPGKLEFEPDSMLALNARCHACHANGPRAIRPDRTSAEKGSISDWFSIALMNLRIRTYPNMSSSSVSPESTSAQFKAPQTELQSHMPLNSCQPCHGKQGKRSPLTFEQAATALFLVEKGFMPPFPFKASDQDLSYLRHVVGRY